MAEKNTEGTDAYEQAPAQGKGYTPKKETPTPRRKVAAAANKRPIVKDRTKLSKEQKKELRRQESEARNAAWNKEQMALRTGDDRNMPAQYAGPVRRFGRDVMDSRVNLGAFFMPFAGLLLVAMVVQRWMTPEVFVIFTIAVYAIFMFMIAWEAVLVRRTRVLTTAKFGGSKIPRGFSWQLLMRSFYPRRWQIPRPQVARGQYPKDGAPEDYAAAKAGFRENKAR